MAARNLGSGITTLTLLVTGQTKAVGVLFMCGVAAPISDSWICVKYGAIEGKAAGHAIMGLIAGALGGGMYWMSS